MIGYNAFAYCGNNPINRFDSTGEFGIWGAVVGGLIGAVAGAISSAVTGGDIKDIVISAAAGAVAGGVIGGFGNVVLARAAASVITAGFTYADCKLNGFTTSESLLCAGVSAAITYSTASLSGLVRNDVVASTLVDCTFGFGGSLVSAGISAGIANTKSNSQTNKPKRPNSTVPKGSPIRSKQLINFQATAWG